MARFELEDGELVLYRERVKNTRVRWQLCRLILTDRRIVLTARDGKPSLLNVFDVLLGALWELRRPTSISHEIRREDYAAAEVTGRRDLKIDSKGEGYAKVWFEISMNSPQEMADRLAQWQLGELSGPSLPRARLVDR